MAWFDKPDLYYQGLPPVSSALSQGEIVVAPTTVILGGEGAAAMIGPATLDDVRETSIWLAAGDELPAAPALSARTRWGLAMIVPHSCALDKEWQERIADLIDVGHSEEAAHRTASAEQGLDEYVTLAPLFALSDTDASKRAGIRMNRRLGNFPVCAIDEIPESYVDLSLLSTVHYSVVPPARRVAALSDLALAHFHYALAMHFAYRSFSGLEAIEGAIGRAILDISVAEKAKGRLVVTLILSEGVELVLEGENRNAPAGDKLPPRPSRV